MAINMDRGCRRHAMQVRDRKTENGDANDPEQCSEGRHETQFLRAYNPPAPQKFQRSSRP